MALNQLVNGFAAALYDRDELMFAAIAEKFDLNLEDIRSVAHEACDKQKPKSIKPQKRQAKRTGAGGKKPRAPSAYQCFVNKHRDEAKRLLMEDEDERIFQNKEGNEVVVDAADFKVNNEPKFGQITQKVAAMWHALSEEEKVPYIEEAKNAKVTHAAASDEEKVKVVSGDGDVSASDDGDESFETPKKAPVRKGKRGGRGKK